MPSSVFLDEAASVVTIDQCASSGTGQLGDRSWSFSERKLCDRGALSLILTDEHDFNISKMNVHEAMARKCKDRYWKSCLINCNPPYSQAELKIVDVHRPAARTIPAVHRGSAVKLRTHGGR
jgi:hypothetical protein